MLAGCICFAACEGDFGNPTRSRSPRALESPVASASPENEVLGAPQGVVPLVRVEMANNKDDKTQVRTIGDEVAGRTSKPTGPVTAASQPAGPVRVTAQKNASDNVLFTRAEGKQVELKVLSTTGIGNIVLERTGDDWPEVITLKLFYPGDRAFTRLEGFQAADQVGDERRVVLKTEANGAAGEGKVLIPGFDRSEKIVIEWVDAYR